MASIRREIEVAAATDQVWDALRDVGRLHERLVQGFVTGCRLDGDVREVDFANGTTVRERIIDIDDAQHRVVWSVMDAPFTHHNASVQAFAESPGHTRLVWIADLLPNELEGPISAMIDQGMTAMKRTLERNAQG